MFCFQEALLGISPGKESYKDAPVESGVISSSKLVILSRSSLGPLQRVKAVETKSNPLLAAESLELPSILHQLLPLPALPRGAAFPPTPPENPELVCAKSQFYSQGHFRHRESRKHTGNIQGGSAFRTSQSLLTILQEE